MYICILGHKFIVVDIEFDDSSIAISKIPAADIYVYLFRQYKYKQPNTWILEHQAT